MDASPRRRLRLTTFAAPAEFERLAARVIPWCWLIFGLTLVLGLYLGFLIAPKDFQQGQSYRIIFIHVPAAWLSMVLYLAMAFWSAVGWAWKVKQARVLALAIAPTGALFTFVALWTGALWGKPTWGTWWVWDARLTSELLLLFLYLAHIALTSAIEDDRRADSAGALLAIVGAVNVPIIYFSVRWWNTLHQGASVSMTSAPKMASTMVTAMLIMTIACWAYAFAVVLTRARAITVEREQQHAWMSKILRPHGDT